VQEALQSTFVCKYRKQCVVYREERTHGGGGDLMKSLDVFCMGRNISENVTKCGMDV